MEAKVRTAPHSTEAQHDERAQTGALHDSRAIAKFIGDDRTDVSSRGTRAAEMSMEIYAE